MSKPVRRNRSLIALSLMAVTAFACWSIASNAFAAPKKSAGSGEAAPKAGPTSFEGKEAPDLTFPMLGSKETMRLSSLKGSVVVLDYWATWCPPCKASLPHLNDLAADKALADQGLKVVAVNDKEKSGVVQEFITENKYTFPVALDLKGDLGSKYLVTGIPTTIVVGRDGKVAKAFVGFGEGSPEALKKAVEEALKAPK